MHLDLLEGVLVQEWLHERPDGLERRGGIDDNHLAQVL